MNISSKPRHIPLVRNKYIRFMIGGIIAVLSPIIASACLGEDQINAINALIFAVIIWFPAVFLTDRYVHKYPQYYMSYLIACYLKGGAIMVFLGGVLWLAGFVPAQSITPMWVAIMLSLFLDFLVSLPHRQVVPAHSDAKTTEDLKTGNAHTAVESEVEIDVPIDIEGILKKLPEMVPALMHKIMHEHIRQSAGGLTSSLVLKDIDGLGDAKCESNIAVLIGTLKLNAVNRLNNYLSYCSSRVTMGGYMVVAYEPMENVLETLKSENPRWLFLIKYGWHFLIYRALPKLPYLDKLYFAPPLVWLDLLFRKTRGGRNRALPKAEVWGRLAFYGMEVVHEVTMDGVAYVVAQRVSERIDNRKPSYFAIVALEKVGLDGELIRLHKVRSMYPFSEFLQKKIFQSHGLTNTGKFKNDFRLTDYGPMIRKRWIDEIPGIFDWLRGDVKLVGMRATSPHYLSLYPKEIYDLYIQVKPGLVPPIFDEKTTGFDDIVEIERKYLASYLVAPLKTDILYFWYTFRDIFIRKVRSS